MRIELTYSAWKADVLPLNYTGVSPDIPPETVRMSILLSNWSHIRDSNSVHPSCGTLPPRHAPGRDKTENEGYERCAISVSLHLLLLYIIANIFRTKRTSFIQNSVLPSFLLRFPYYSPSRQFSPSYIPLCSDSG